MFIVKNHLIDCDAYPFVPDNLGLFEHRRSGQLGWDKKVQGRTFLLPGGKTGLNLLGDLVDSPVLNANPLDYLKAHQYDVPKEYDGKIVLFFGTIYRYRVGGGFCVRGLLRSDSKYIDLSIGLENPLYDEHYVIALNAAA